MKNPFRSLVAGAALAVTLLFSGSAMAFQTPKQAPAAAPAKAGVASAVSDREIADAQSKGLVWVNESSKIYHKSGQFYGKTKRGKFMTEADAQKAGYRAAKDSAIAKKPSPSKK